MCWFSLSFSSQKCNRSFAIVKRSPMRWSFELSCRSSISGSTSDRQKHTQNLPPHRRNPQSGGVLDVEIRSSLWLISPCFYSSKASDLIHHLHFQNTTEGIFWNVVRCTVDTI